MSNPFTFGSTTTFANGPGGSPDNLTSLPSATALGLGWVDLHAAVAAGLLIEPMKIKSGASGTSATGYVRRLLITSSDGTTATSTDGIDPASASNQLSKIAAATLLDTIAVTANATTYWFPAVDPLAVLNLLVPPKYIAVIIDNESGHALDTSVGSFLAQYTPISYA